MMGRIAIELEKSRPFDRVHVFWEKSLNHTFVAEMILLGEKEKEKAVPKCFS